ncbi:hypothetical protein DPMN_045561 [Dreissena polymorpha]|uniref:Secreted protein n=1 Tax=Dreissena polymorpha TaxID=45954 RepID=A0A9D4D811_DREPO|nr:hypothetical protein DPMN_045561 [Dreissena polymorpha]
MPCATWIALIAWVDLGRLGLTWVDLGRLGLTWVDLGRLGLTWVDLGRLGSTWGVLGDLGHLGCLTPIATSLQCLPSALRKEDNQCPPSAFMQGRQSVSVVQATISSLTDSG